MTESAPLSDAEWSLELPTQLRVELSQLREAYFRHVDVEAADSPIGGIASNILREHVRLAMHREPGQAVTRLHRPGDGTGVGAAMQIVTDDMPLLVESVTALLLRVDVCLAEVVHPIFVVRRDRTGALTDVLLDASVKSAPEGCLVESWMHVQLHPATEQSQLDTIENDLDEVLSDVRQVVADTDAMRARQRELADDLDAAAVHPPTGHSAEELTDTADLLRWFAAGHFAMLGYRRYELGPADDRGERTQRSVPGSGLGVLRSDALADSRLNLPFGAEIPNRTLLVLTQGSHPATVHRSAYPYIVGVSILDQDGTITGEHRFLGVFTVTALHENVLDIPVIERRVRTVIDRAGFEMSSYSGQSMLEVIQSFPRTELFSCDTETLCQTITSVIGIGLQRQVRLFIREDEFGRFVSCLIYLPRDRYTTRVRLSMQNILLRELGEGALEYTARVTEGDLAMLHVTIRKPLSRWQVRIDASERNRRRIQALLTEASRTWNDHLIDAAAADPSVDPILAQHYADLLPDGYKEDFEPRRALADILRLDALQVDSTDLVLYRHAGAEPGQWRFTLYIGSEGITLSRVLPVLQSLGVEVLDERPYQVIRSDGMSCWIYDFGLAVPADVLRTTIDRSLDVGVEEAESSARFAISVGNLQQRFTEAFTAIWHGFAEADRFNELVLRAGLGWRQAAMLRSYTKYLRQAGFPYSQFRIEGVLANNPETTGLLVDLFEAMFDPQSASAARVRGLEHELRGRIDAVVSLETDRILRGLFGLIQATLRTNYFVVDETGAVRKFLAFKFDPARITELPLPRPRFEVFVCSPEVEGVHLRFGAVARGGLRWSDRREDFRTEILGLAKAQAVKNAVIVPVGAKGGFVVKNPHTPTGDAAADRLAVRAQGEKCYRLFISGLLDVTDNYDRATGRYLPPRRVVRRDGDDAYLVVAADKGTATFSDLANSVAKEYSFWLGDAFASGGSAGYDHKAMGITARGAWESVKRHFRELGIDTQRRDFTVTGVGDMSGDVFGNGMLLSEHIRLVAAFDHRHIFLDPNPDAARSFVERRRLFDLPRSSWADYDPSTISLGGGVWERTRKSVPISKQAGVALGLDPEVTELPPPELIRAILQAPVDLLWNGGIGTYIKAMAESDADVGDKSNDAVRVNGNEVRARVVGEGGNLGVTALGRIEYSLAGGKINTDALDNSAGVDCSDHEVNIKILLDSMVGTGALAPEDRNPLLESMTDEVGRLVLADNISQNNLMGLSRASAVDLLSVHGRLIADLVAQRGLDRKLQALPTEAELNRRRQAGVGLTSPELATLLAHVKLALKDDLLATDLPDSETFATKLPGYFPVPLRQRFGAGIKAHPLRRQIVATMLANETIDDGGITYAYRLAEDAGASSTDAIRAYAAVTGIFGLPEIWRRIREAGLCAPITDDLTLESQRVLDRASRWLLSHRPQPLAVGAEISRYAATYAALAPRVGGWMHGHQLIDLDERSAPLLERGAPRDLTLDVFRLLDQYPLLDVIDIADIAERDAAEVAELYYAMDAHLGIDWLLSAVSALPRGDRWHSLARLSLRDELYDSLRSLTLDVLAGAEPHETTREMILEWESTNSSRLARARAALEEIYESGTIDLATLSVAARQVQSMVG